MSSPTLLIRGLLVVVLAALSGMVAFRSKPRPSPPPQPPRVKETDLPRVFDQLHEWPALGDLRHWCGLELSVVRPDIAVDLRRAVESAPDPSRVWCGPRGEKWRTAPPGKYPFPKSIEWFKLSHPSDPGRWIGVGVYTERESDSKIEWIICRLAVGFDPTPPPEPTR